MSENKNVLDEVKTGHVLSKRELDSLKEQRAIHAGILNATESSFAMGNQGATPVVPSGLTFNRQKMNQRAKDLDRAIQEQSPRHVDGKERDALANRRKELEEMFAKDGVLETRAELHVVRRDSPVWLTAMEKAKMRPKYEGAIKEWQNISRILEPENEDADNLNRLRKEK